MKIQNVMASEKSRMLFLFFFLQKYPFGECVFFEIIYNIIIEDISMPI